MKTEVTLNVPMGRVIGIKNLTTSEKNCRVFNTNFNIAIFNYIMPFM